MNTMQLSCFVEVASTLSFSKAAEHLHVSQPTVSHQVRSLESELGCSLLVRSTRTVRLTDEGFTFISYAHEQKAIIYYDVNFRKSHAHEAMRIMPAFIENMNRALGGSATKKIFNMKVKSAEHCGSAGRGECMICHGVATIARELPACAERHDFLLNNLMEDM